MPDSSLFEITVQSTTIHGEYRLSAEWRRSGELPVRREHGLQLDHAQLPEYDDPLRYGEALGHLVFAGSVHELFAQARAATSELRVLLAVEAKTLQSLRWERLAGPFDDEGWQPLGQTRRTPFSQYLPSSTDRRFPPFGRRDLRALVVVANPESDNAYGVDPFDETQAIDTVLAGLGEIPSVILGKDPRAEGPPTLGELCTRLTAEHYTLLHLISHGAYSTRTGETAVFLAGEPGPTEAVKATDLIARLKQLGTARGLPHLAFLAVCDSAKPDAEGAFGGLGQRLVRELGMPAVVAMTERVSQATAFALGKGLYARLREHGQVDTALVQACAEVRQHDDSVVPALFSRLGGRPLFTDDLDRPLTEAELRATTEQVDALFHERAPVLRDQARVLAEAVSIDPSTLMGLAAREHATSLTRLEQLCEDALELSFSALAHGRAPPPYRVRCPFPGLRAFTAEQREYFCGRDPLVQALRRQLDERPFLAVLGNSGCGKSSLVMAGVIPLLRDLRPALEVATLTPGEHPLARLQEALVLLQDAPDTLIYVDQFEEAFTICGDDLERKGFFDRLLDVVAPQHRVVISMRADFLGECALHRGLREQIEGLSLIPPMSADELRNAIEQQGQAAGLRYETGLCEQILEDLEDEPGAMPLLQHALQELYQRRHGRWLPVEAYHELGRVQKAITKTAEQVWATLDDEDQERLQSIMLELAEVREAEGGGSIRYLRRRVALAHLYYTRATSIAPWSSYAGPAEEPSIKRLIDLLADERLLVKSHADEEGPVVEVAHEALLSGWDRLQRWLTAARDAIRLRQEMEASATGWRNNDLRRVYLEHIHERGELVRSFLREGTLKLDPKLREYFEACQEEERRQHQEREQQQQEKIEAAQALASEQSRRVRQLRRAALGVGLVGLFAALMAVRSYTMQRRAEDARDEADAWAQEANAAKAKAESEEQKVRRANRELESTLNRQRGLTAALMANEPGSQVRALFMALEASNEGSDETTEGLPLEIENALFAATQGLHGVRELRGHQEAVVDIAFSQDSQRRATASRHDTLQKRGIRAPR
ncbi:MAG: CHAT domain-containing protein, partial [Myxococcota bacterium]